VDPFVGAVRRTLAQRQMMLPGERLLAALSGGADSVALVAALLDLGEAVVAAHFNHRWRGLESERDEAFARGLCRQLGVELVVGSGAAVPRRAVGGLEQAGREARYAFLHQAARARGCARIATGHTRDDQAETVLLRLLRGSGAAGLAGIQPVRADGVVRPLIDVARADVLAYLQRRRLTFVDDSSNADLRFSRNRLRALVLPALRRVDPRASERLAALADTFAMAAAQGEALAAEVLARAATADGGLDVRALAERAPAVRALVARAWLGDARGTLRRLTAAHIAAVSTCLASGARVKLPGGDSVVNEHGVLRLVTAATEAGRCAAVAAGEQASLMPGGSLCFGRRWLIAASAVRDRPSALPSDLWQAVLDADVAVLPLVVRRWRHGDRLQPLGMRGHRKLADVFIDAKVPRWRRHILPVVEGGGRILWVPGVVRSADAALRATSSRVVWLQAREKPPG
jgi:tRNA(Ile)-lysidine synthase